MNIDHDLFVLITKVAFLLHLLGIFSALQAVAQARSPQGAIAWAISLISFPYLTLPLYWIFGRDRFHGYTVDRRVHDSGLAFVRESLRKKAPISLEKMTLNPAVRSVLEGLADMRFNFGNQAELCVNGQATFTAIFQAFDAAKEYILVQFFIVKDDEIGQAFKAKLLEAAGRGVRIYFLYDEVGSHKLPKSYITELRKASIQIFPFKTTKGLKNRFQINFRNHRKIVVVDGQVTIIGGHNVGDEYMGKDPKFGPWRDTHVRIEGPAALQAQASFVEDWHWSVGDSPDLKWEIPQDMTNGKAVLILPTGPADPLDTCCLFFLQAINYAKRRIWITSPYFVPDPQIISALQLATMRGVDVRIILPSMADHLFVYLASFAFLKETVPLGIKLFRFQNGFIHEKVLLVDDDLASVGTANFDNRSFRLNFEITAIFNDVEFGKKVEQMLLDDFSKSKPVAMSEIESRSFLFKMAVKIARLTAPIL